MATEFKLPEVGEGIAAGTVVALLVKVGDSIEKDQPVLELETDKAVVEVPSSVAGVVASINVKANEQAQVGQVILTVSEEGAAGEGEAPASAVQPKEQVEGGEQRQTEGAADDQAQAEKEQAQTQDGAQAAGSEADAAPPQPQKAAQADAPKAAGTEGAAPRPPATGGGANLIPAAPSVRRLARELGVDLAAASGSGILGRISAEDVQRLAGGEGVSAPAAPALPRPEAPELPDFGKWGETERQPMSGIRKATVRSMAQAWSTVPMVTQFDKADITEFEALRKRYQPKAEAVGAKLTPTAMLLKVVAGALRKFPDFNASLDLKTNEIVYKRYVNLGVAVDTENGLLVPVIKNADRKNMIELAQELGELAEKARARKLSPEDMQGGNFNVSNLGGIGGTGFTPIVNPPDVAILGVSRGAYEPVYNKDTGGFDARMMMPLSLTYDHRLIDGALAARFLRWVCQAIEEPFLLALEG